MDLAFRRIAIINRGEPAMRLLHAVRELNQQHGWHLQTIALYTDPDRNAMFVREADDRYYIGEATYVDPRDGQRKSSYLDYERLKRALVETRADAAWVGWGFVAEHAAFVDLCDELAVNFIGPSGDVMRKMGDKIASKRLAEAADVPVTPWSNGPIESVEQAYAEADRLGYPVILKASAGGGGRGIRRVKAHDAMEAAFKSARSEALKAFGDDTLFMEQMVTEARHIEVQVVADKHGTTWAVGVRDCTVQRRNQKVIEEAPSPILSAEEDLAVREAAKRLAAAAGYFNAGTVECLFDQRSRKFYFMEMNTRLQVEHPVTELATRLDLVKLQLHVASGGKLPSAEPPAHQGHAIEVRLNAEDPDNNFAPAPGRVELFKLPTGSGIRIDTGVDQGDEVPPDFDSMIAKIIAYGHDRHEALGRLRRALLESAVVIRGGSSNKAFLLELLDNPDVVASQVDIGWLDRLTESGKKGQRPLADIALIRAAIDVYEEEFLAEKAQFFAGAARGRPVFSLDIGRSVEVGYGGQSYQIEVYKLGPSLYRVRVEGRAIEAMLDQQGSFAGWITCAGMRYRVISVQDGPAHLVEVDGMSHRVSRDEGGLVRAPAPAVVLALSVEPGQSIQTGDQLLVLEAMKTEMGVNAPFSGKVRSIEVLPNQQVSAGAPLMMIEPESDGQEEEQTERVVFRPDPGRTQSDSPHDQARELLTEMKRLVLGYDVDAMTAKQIRKRRAAVCERLAPNDERLWELENEVITILADLLPLFRRESNGQPASPDEYLQSYMRGIDAGRERLPESFLSTLERALRHYDVETLDPTPQLKSALVFVHKSRARLQRSVDQVFDLIERRLLSGELVRERATPEFRALLDRLIDETHGLYLPLNDLARELRYLLFDRPAFEKAREQIYTRMDLVVASLVEAAPAEDRAGQLEELVNCPQPMISFLSRTYGDPGAARRLAVEVMLRRYYRIRPLENIQVHTRGEYEVAAADFAHEGRQAHIVAVACPFAELSSALASVRPQIESYGTGDDVYLDIYASHDDIDDLKRLAKSIQSALSGARPTHPMRRACIALVKPGNLSTIRYFTYLQTEMGFQEQEILRGLHPMLAERLELWRLENFETKQLRVSDDIYLFHAVARDNPKDERLFAFVEIRDMTPVFNDAGDVVEIPGLEWKFLEALADIRDFQSHRTPRERLHWNRVMLFIRPETNVTLDTVRHISYRLAPAGKTLGLEKVVATLNLVDPETKVVKKRVVHASNRAGTGLEIVVREPSVQPLRSLDPYTQNVVRMRRFGMVYPYEILRMLTPAKPGDGELHHAEFPSGDFVEYDLNAAGELAPIEREVGKNKANLVIGLITNYTAKYPDGMKRVICLGDGSRSMGALAEPECVRIIKALDLAEELKVPFEWFPVSSGAKISMDVGTEGLDWIARVLRRLVEFTQAGHEINVVIPGVNVGGQSYWNAEATMLMHTRGILIMTPTASMVLTGKKALDYSGGVSAEDNQGIGGVERIMGFNGQAQYAAKDIAEACHILFRYYNHTYVVPGERWPRRYTSSDANERDVCEFPHQPVEGVEFKKVGEVFSPASNPGRKKPFDIRSVMSATIDQDQKPLERWSMMRLAETAVVWDAHLGGFPVCLIGIESRPQTRLGFVPGDGPDVWTGGTLFPRSSKKVARAINAASGNRPVVVLANLSGFDGSPESMREWQLEYGAEIGRAVVNFDGPLIFCVISRYHGGAYVVFSCTLNENMQVAALEGSYASVIGGAPAAAVVFPKDVRSRTMADPRVKAAKAALEAAPDDVSRARLRAEYEKIHRAVDAEKQGEVADYFDSVHNVQRAKDVGSLHEIIDPVKLRPWLVEAIERGIEKVTA